MSMSHVPVKLSPRKNVSGIESPLKGAVMSDQNRERTLVSTLRGPQDHIKLRIFLSQNFNIV